MTRRRAAACGLALLALSSFCQSSRSDHPADKSVRIVPNIEEPSTGPQAEREIDRMAGVRGPKDNPNPHMARTQMLEQVGGAGPSPFSVMDSMTGEADGTTGFGLGGVGRMGHGFGAGDGVGFGRAAGDAGKAGSRFGGRGGGGSIPVAGSRARMASRGDDGDEETINCEDADEIVVIEANDAQGPGTDDGSATQGTLRAKGADGDVTGEFPLKHTEVSAEISGSIGKTEVEQVYQNPFREVLEAVYVFPLPAMGAVNDFVMEVRGRKIVGLIRPREEAEKIYAEARERGQTASLLTQERSNVFTQNVANIEPGGEVKIKITYFERLVYEHGTYEWVFPMVVGPRYIPGAPTADVPREAPSPEATAPPLHRSTAPSSGGGWSPPTDVVPDADRITPPVLRPGERSGHDIGLTVTLDAGLPIQDLKSVAHAVESQEVSASKRIIKLSSADAIPNKDFVLRWSVAGAETQFGVLAHRSDAGGFFTLMMQPPLGPRDEQVTPREITFILDVSGSMQGLPVGLSKAVVQKALDKLRPDDVFNVYYFASGSGQLWQQPHPPTDENVAAARQFLEDLDGSGGTEMLAGIRRALQAEHDARRLQMYVFLTDGFVGDEERILALVRDERGAARFFAFGIGSSVNRFLIDGIGESGGGASDVVLPYGGGESCRAVERLFEAIDSPVLVDVRIDWNGLPVEDVYPAKLPDLFAGKTIAVVGRFTGAAAGTAYVEARVGSRQVRYPVAVTLPEAEPANEALAPIWARWRIDELSKELLAAEADVATVLRQKITDLAVEFRLVSQFTAFVAVDGSRVVGNGQPLRVMQPVEVPAGTSYEGVFGELPVELPRP